MAKFRFSLQPVLEHRRRLEERLQMALAAQRRELDLAQAELMSLNQEFRRHSDELRFGHKSLDIDALRLRYAHLQFLDRSIDAQIHVVAQRRTEVEVVRLETLAASKDRKVVERLRERRSEEHATEETLHEQKELDDANARVHARNRSQGVMP